MGSPVTTNPITIMLINMTVVFAVLYGLSLVIRLIKLADPTQKKKLNEPSQPEPAVIGQTAEADSWDEDEEVAVVIAAAVAACGYSVVSVTAVRPESSRAWRQAARLEAIGNKLQAMRK